MLCFALVGLLVPTRFRQPFINIVNEVKMHQRQPARCILLVKFGAARSRKVSGIFWSWKTINNYYQVKKLAHASWKVNALFLSESAEWNDLRTPVPSSFYTYYLSIIHGASY